MFSLGAKYSRMKNMSVSMALLGVHVSGAPSMERELIERRVGKAPSVER